MNALVVGISADSQQTQQKFIDKFGLTFPMISDTERSIIEAWGARKVLGVTAARSTFLIGPDGKVVHTWPKVKLEGHADDVVNVIRSLSE